MKSYWNILSSFFFPSCPPRFTTDRALLKPQSKVLQENGLEIECCPVEDLGNQNGINETMSARLHMLLLIRKAITFSRENYSLSDPVPCLYERILNYYNIQCGTVTKT